MACCVINCQYIHPEEANIVSSPCVQSQSQSQSIFTAIIPDVAWTARPLNSRIARSIKQCSCSAIQLPRSKNLDHPANVHYVPPAPAGLTTWGQSDIHGNRYWQPSMSAKLNRFGHWNTIPATTTINTDNSLFWRRGSNFLLTSIICKSPTNDTDSIAQY